jgi:DNA-binding NarL/FixJ family response regulator
LRPFLKHPAKTAPSSRERERRRLRVLIADDHRMFLQAVQALLQRRGFAVVGLASDGAEAVHLATTTHPDVAILDVLMPKLNGLDAARVLLTSAPDTAVVLVTGGADLEFVLEGMTLGVRGFVVKTAAIDELFDAIKAASQGATYVSPAFEGAVKAALPAGRAVGPRPLTSREREVLRLIAEGKTSKQVAIALHVALKTAETHRARIMKKLDIHGLAGLVRYAIRERIASA